MKVSRHALLLLRDSRAAETEIDTRGMQCYNLQKYTYPEGIIMQKQSVGRQLVMFSIPLILSGLMQQLFSWTDAFILGNVVGEGALAAVGASSAVTNLFVLAVTGFTSGLGILAARYFGAGKWSELRRLLGSYTMILAAAMLVIMACGQWAAEGMLRAMDTPEDIFDQATEYLRIVLLGAPFVIIYNVYSAVLRGVGNSRTPFVCVSMSGALNVALDWVLVAWCGLDIAGAAWATAVSQAVGAVLVVAYTVHKYKELRFVPSREVFSLPVMKSGLRLGLPVTARSVVSALGSVLLQNFMNGFGSTTVAAISTSYRVDSMLLLPVMNLSVGISTMVSQSIGAGDRPRAHRFFNRGMQLMLGVACVLTVVICAFGGQLVALFGVGEEAVDIGRRFFIRLSLFYPMFAVMRAITGYLEGLGDVTFTGAVTVVSLAVRLGASYALKPMFGNMVLAWAEVISWVFMLAAFSARYFYKRRREDTSIDSRHA